MCSGLGSRRGPEFAASKNKADRRTVTALDSSAMWCLPSHCDPLLGAQRGCGETQQCFEVGWSQFFRSWAFAESVRGGWAVIWGQSNVI